jgi:hypothetical protein
LIKKRAAPPVNGPEPPPDPCPSSRS